MKGLLLFGALLSVAGVLVFVCGCKESPPTQPQLPSAGSVQIVMSDDTLRPWSGSDTVSTGGYVLVTDEAGRAMRGRVVHMALSDTLGWLTWTWPDMSFATDHDGVAAFLYHTVTPAAIRSTTISGWVDSAEDRHTVWVYPRQIPAYLAVHLEPDTIHTLNPLYGYTMVSVTVADSGFVPISGLQLTVRAPGSLSAFPATYSNGQTATSWRPQSYGRSWIVITAGPLTDSASVVVDAESTVHVGSIFLTVPVTHFDPWPGDTIRQGGHAHVFAAEGYALPGQHVELTVSGSVGTIEYANPELRDTTDAWGFVEFIYTAINVTAPCSDEIRARRDSVEARQPLSFLPHPRAPMEFRVEADRDTIHRHGAGYDTVRVTATLLDSLSEGISGVSLPAIASTGYVWTFSPTNTNGRTYTSWLISGYGRHALISNVWHLADTVWVVVDSLSDGKAGGL